MTRTMTALGVLMATAAVPLLAQRFDNVVRADFFAGYRGDDTRLARGMETCEQALARDPHDAPALVWHGGGLFFLSGQKFRAGDWQGGLAMQERGLKEMDEAVALRPDSLETLIPRGATLLASAPHFPDDASARPILLKGVGDYEKVERLQSGGTGLQAAHSRGELLGGLAVGYRLLGDRDNATKYLKRIVDELPGTAYAAKASEWLAHPEAVKKTDRFCLGCHEQSADAGPQLPTDQSAAAGSRLQLPTEQSADAGPQLPTDQSADTGPQLPTDQSADAGPQLQTE